MKRLLTPVATAFVAYGAVLASLEFWTRRQADPVGAREAFLERYGDDVATNASDVLGSSDEHLHRIYEATLEDRRNLRGIFHEGQEQWLETLVHLDDPAFASMGRLGCASRHGSNASTCFYRLSMVIEPLGETRGRVTHAESELVDPALGPVPTGENHADCQAFVRCVAQVRVGEVIPIPADETKPFALEELFHASQANEALFQPAKLRETIGQFEQAAAWHEAQPGRSATAELKLRKLQNTAAYLRQHLQRLEATP